MVAQSQKLVKKANNNSSRNPSTQDRMGAFDRIEWQRRIAKQGLSHAIRSFAFSLADIVDARTSLVWGRLVDTTKHNNVTGEREERPGLPTRLNVKRSSFYSKVKQLVEAGFLYVTKPDGTNEQRVMLLKLPEEDTTDIINHLHHTTWGDRYTFHAETWRPSTDNLSHIVKTFMRVSHYRPVLSSFLPLVKEAVQEPEEKIVESEQIFTPCEQIVTERGSTPYIYPDQDPVHYPDQERGEEGESNVEDLQPRARQIHVVEDPAPAPQTKKEFQSPEQKTLSQIETLGKLFAIKAKETWKNPPGETFCDEYVRILASSMTPLNLNHLDAFLGVKLAKVDTAYAWKRMLEWWKEDLIKPWHPPTKQPYTTLSGCYINPKRKSFVENFGEYVPEKMSQRKLWLNRPNEGEWSEKRFLTVFRFLLSVPIAPEDVLQDHAEGMKSAYEDYHHKLAWTERTTFEEHIGVPAHLKHTLELEEQVKREEESVTTVTLSIPEPPEGPERTGPSESDKVFAEMFPPSKQQPAFEVIETRTWREQVLEQLEGKEHFADITLAIKRCHWEEDQEDCSVMLTHTKDAWMDDKKDMFRAVLSAQLRKVAGCVVALGTREV